MIVRRTGDIARAFYLRLCWEHAGRREQERRRGRRAQGEGEGTVWAHGYAGGDRRSGRVVCCTGVEFLYPSVRIEG